VPEAPSGPDSLGQRESGSFAFYNTDGVVLRIRYVVDWADHTRDTSGPLRLGDTVALEHAWQDTGAFSVVSRALAAEGTDFSDWSQPLVVTVVNRPPGAAVTPLGPDTLLLDSAGEFSSRATDPEGDLLRFVFAWGNGDSSLTDWYASGATARVLHAWHETGTWAVRARAVDAAGHTGAWSGPHHVLVVAR
jgi:hypothetical protein